MTKVDGSLMFEPDTVVGFVSGNDPIFEQYKEIIGSFHLTPQEVYTWFFEKYQLTPSPIENLTVVAYILPITKKTKKENLEYSNEYPGERWANPRSFANGASPLKSLP